MKGFLRQVVEEKKQEIAAHSSRLPLTTLRRKAEQAPAPADFLSAMALGTRDAPGIIAEIKKASPSKGDIRPDLDAAAYAQAYTKAGARAVSVLTEARYFKGSLEDLKTVCRHTDLPVLRKDFIFTEYQILEAKKAGASAVLLITTLLSPAQQAEFTAMARELGMEPLVEINSEWEFEQAFQAAARVVGINNRNLATLETDPKVAGRVAKIFPDTIIAVAASGISSRADIEKGLDDRLFNFLIGESIVRAQDPGAFIRALLKKDPEA